MDKDGIKLAGTGASPKLKIDASQVDIFLLQLSLAQIQKRMEENVSNDADELHVPLTVVSGYV